MTPVSSTNKTDHHDITEIVLKSGIKHHNPNPEMYPNTSDSYNQSLNIFIWPHFVDIFYGSVVTVVVIDDVVQL